MKRSRVGLIIIASLVLNTVLMLQSFAAGEVMAAFPGYNGKIVFDSLRDGVTGVYEMNNDGSSPRNVIGGGGNNSDGEYSPDGSKIVFSTNRDGDSEIYTINANGTNLTRLTNSPGLDVHPKWSPDGTKIIFRSNRDGNNEIYIMNQDGSNQVNLTNNPASDVDPAWSPLGDKIAFISTRLGQDELFTMNVNGSSQAHFEISTISSFRRFPDWSPDGQGLLLVQTVNGSPEVFTVHVEDGLVEQLTENGQNKLTPIWSPDGMKIAFAQTNGDHSDIMVMNADGTNLINLTNDQYSEVYPRWHSVRNNAPALVADSAKLLVNGTLSKDVLANDKDEEPLNPANLTIHIQPAHGTASIESGKVKYTPNHNYVGTDQLTYRICDSFMLDQKCSTAALAITVTPAVAVAKVGEVSYEDGKAKYIASSNRPIFSGTAVPGSFIKVEIHSDPIVLTTAADENGNWSIIPNQDLPPGDHTVYISAMLNGVTTELDSFVLAVQQTVPNTGFDSLGVRGSGLILLMGGLVCAFVYRRRMRNYFEQVPRIFP